MSLVLNMPRWAGKMMRVDEDQAEGVNDGQTGPKGGLAPKSSRRGFRSRGQTRMGTRERCFHSCTCLLAHHVKRQVVLDSSTILLARSTPTIRCSLKRS